MNVTRLDTDEPVAAKKMPQEWGWREKEQPRDALWAKRKNLCYITIQKEIIQSYLDRSRVSLNRHCFIEKKYFET